MELQKWIENRWESYTDDEKFRFQTKHGTFTIREAPDGIVVRSLDENLVIRPEGANGIVIKEES